MGNPSGGLRSGGGTGRAAWIKLTAGSCFMRQNMAILGLSAALLVVTSIAVVAIGAARYFYLRGKLAAAQPVGKSAYLAENSALGARTEARGTLPPRILLIGDSRIHEWRFDGGDLGWETLNRGLVGETTAQLRFRFQSDALALHPDVLVIQSGINDLVAAAALGKAGATLANQTLATLQELATQASEMGIPVVLTTIIPPFRPSLLRRIVWSDEIYGRVQYVNQQLLHWTPPPGVRVIDIAPLKSAEQRLNSSFARDCLHMNAIGYDALTRLLLPEIQLALKRPAPQRSETSRSSNKPISHAGLPAHR